MIDLVICLVVLLMFVGICLLLSLIEVNYQKEKKEETLKEFRRLMDAGWGIIESVDLSHPALNNPAHREPTACVVPWEKVRTLHFILNQTKKFDDWQPPT